MKPEGALTFITAPDLTEVSLQDVFSRLVKPCVATLRVHSAAFLSAKSMLKHIGAYAADNPLSPQVNLLVDENYTDEYEWSLEIDGTVIWGPGV